MGLVRYLQHWLSGAGAPLQVTDFVPQSDPIRQWADTWLCRKSGCIGVLGRTHPDV